MDFVVGFAGTPICENPWEQLGWQLVCIVAIITWSLLWMIPIFLFLKKIGKLRVSEEVEINGLDIYKHGEAAYPLHAYGHGWDEYEPIKDKATGKASNRRKFSDHAESESLLLLSLCQEGVIMC
ncbi:hypothetical protein ANCDUO_00213 [Ancylostoma duodenale]|uniref:Ammonium transporter AmtB-like domain-containing protein n=1 Tax=Ancylostoma duodenale TaxID=51022 RepID=A0A0C2DHM2_9BILA|nr:hypothetical protein ANCDUO_00213 [Ancylostoma duodenale]